MSGDNDCDGGNGIVKVEVFLLVLITRTRKIVMVIVMATMMAVIIMMVIEKIVSITI